MTNSKRRKNTNDLLVLAERAIEEERIVPAIKLLEGCVKANPDDPYALYAYGDSLRRIGRYEDSKVTLLSALGHKDEDLMPQLVKSLACLHLDWRETDEAEIWFSRLIEFGEYRDKGWVCVLRGSNLLVKGDFNAAEKAFLRALDFQDVDLSEASLNLGLCYRAQRKYVDARRFFEQALVHNNNYIEAREALDSIDGVDDALEQATSIRSEIAKGLDVKENIEKLYNLAQLSRERSGEASAAEVLEGYLSYMPGNSYALFLYGDSLRLLGRYSESKAIYLKALELSEELHKADVMTRLALLCHDYGARYEANAWLKQVESSKAYDGLDWFWVLYGKNHLLLNNFIAAEVCFRRALLQVKDESADDIVLNICFSLRAQAKYPEALALIEDVLKRAPGNILAQEMKNSMRGIDDVGDR